MLQQSNYAFERLGMGKTGERMKIRVSNAMAETAAAVGGGVLWFAGCVVKMGVPQMCSDDGRFGRRDLWALSR